MYIVNLYNVRWCKKYTQDEIIQATGLSKKTVSQLFSGKYFRFYFRIKKLINTLCKNIGKFFNCKIHDILIEVDDEE